MMSRQRDDERLEGLPLSLRQEREPGPDPSWDGVCLTLKLFIYKVTHFQFGTS